MKQIGLFYAPQKGACEKTANLIADAIGRDNVDMIVVTEHTNNNDIKLYDKLILGLSTVGRDTWDSSYDKIGWDFIVHKVKDWDLTGKTVAMFGLGNQIMYGDHFADSLGILGDNIKQTQAKIVGKWSIEGYDFTNSLALADENTFIGLTIDEDNEPEKTEDRVTKWVNLIKAEMGF